MNTCRKCKSESSLSDFETADGLEDAKMVKQRIFDELKSIVSPISIMHSNVVGYPFCYVDSDDNKIHYNYPLCLPISKTSEVLSKKCKSQPSLTEDIYSNKDITFNGTNRIFETIPNADSENITQILAKLFKARKLLDPVINEIILNASQLTIRQIHEFRQDKFPLCYITAKQFRDTSRVINMFMEVIEELSNKKSPIPQKATSNSLSHFNKIIVNTLCLVSKEENTGNASDQKVFVDKFVLKELIQLYEVLGCTISVIQEAEKRRTESSESKEFNKKSMDQSKASPDKKRKAQGSSQTEVKSKNSRTKQCVTRTHQERECQGVPIKSPKKSSQQIQEEKANPYKECVQQRTCCFFPRKKCAKVKKEKPKLDQECEKRSTGCKKNSNKKIEKEPKEKDGKEKDTKTGFSESKNDVLLEVHIDGRPIQIRMNKETKSYLVKSIQKNNPLNITANEDQKSTDNFQSKRVYSSQNNVQKSNYTPSKGCKCKGNEAFSLCKSYKEDKPDVFNFASTANVSEKPDIIEVKSPPMSMCAPTQTANGSNGSFLGSLLRSDRKSYAGSARRESVCEEDSSNQRKQSNNYNYKKPNAEDDSCSAKLEEIRRNYMKRENSSSNYCETSSKQRNSNCCSSGYQSKNSGPRQEDTMSGTGNYKSRLRSENPKYDRISESSETRCPEYKTFRCIAEKDIELENGIKSSRSLCLKNFSLTQLKSSSVFNFMDSLLLKQKKVPSTEKYKIYTVLNSQQDGDEEECLIECCSTKEKTEKSCSCKKRRNRRSLAKEERPDFNKRKPKRSCLQDCDSFSKNHSIGEAYTQTSSKKNYSVDRNLTEEAEDGEASKNCSSRSKSTEELKNEPLDYNERHCKNQKSICSGKKAEKSSQKCAETVSNESLYENLKQYLKLKNQKRRNDSNNDSCNHKIKENKKCENSDEKNQNLQSYLNESKNFDADKKSEEFKNKNDTCDINFEKYDRLKQFSLQKDNNKLYYEKYQDDGQNRSDQFGNSFEKSKCLNNDQFKAMKRDDNYPANRNRIADGSSVNNEYERAYNSLRPSYIDQMNGEMLSKKYEKKASSTPKNLKNYKFDNPDDLFDSCNIRERIVSQNKLRNFNKNDGNISICSFEEANVQASMDQNCRDDSVVYNKEINEEFPLNSTFANEELQMKLMKEKEFQNKSVRNDCQESIRHREKIDYNRMDEKLQNERRFLGSLDENSVQKNFRNQFYKNKNDTDFDKVDNSKFSSSFKYNSKYGEDLHRNISNKSNLTYTSKEAYKNNDSYINEENILENQKLEYKKEKLDYRMNSNTVNKINDKNTNHYSLENRLNYDRNLSGNQTNEGEDPNYFTNYEQTIKKNSRNFDQNYSPLEKSLKNTEYKDGSRNETPNIFLEDVYCKKKEYKSESVISTEEIPDIRIKKRSKSEESKKSDNLANDRIFVEKHNTEIEQQTFHERQNNNYFDSPEKNYNRSQYFQTKLTEKEANNNCFQDCKTINTQTYSIPNHLGISLNSKNKNICYTNANINRNCETNIDREKNNDYQYLGSEGNTIINNDTDSYKRNSKFQYGRRETNNSTGNKLYQGNERGFETGMKDGFNLVESSNEVENNGKKDMMVIKIMVPEKAAAAIEKKFEHGIIHSDPNMIGLVENTTRCSKHTRSYKSETEVLNDGGSDEKPFQNCLPCQKNHRHQNRKTNNVAVDSDGSICQCDDVELNDFSTLKHTKVFGCNKSSCIRVSSGKKKICLDSSKHISRNCSCANVGWKETVLEAIYGLLFSEENGNTNEIDCDIELDNSSTLIRLSQETQFPSISGIKKIATNEAITYTCNVISPNLKQLTSIKSGLDGGVVSQLRDILKVKSSKLRKKGNKLDLSLTLAFQTKKENASFLTENVNDFSEIDEAHTSDQRACTASSENWNNSQELSSTSFLKRVLRNHSCHSILINPLIENSFKID